MMKTAFVVGLLAMVGCAELEVEDVEMLEEELCYECEIEPKPPVPRPDLVMGSFCGVTRGQYPNNYPYHQFQVKNQGTATSLPSTLVISRWRTDNWTHISYFNHNEEYVVPSLAPGASYTVSNPVDWDYDVKCGGSNICYMELWADGKFVVTESSESNNGLRCNDTW